MKAKVYIPIIVGAGAAAGLILGLSNIGPRVEKKTEETQTVVAQETTTAKPAETKKDSKADDDKKKEEENKKKEEEKKKKEEEEKKKAEEEKKKKEEEEKKEEQEEKDKEKETDPGKDSTEEAKTADKDNSEGDGEVVYEYVYVPVNSDQVSNADNNAGGNSGNQAPSPSAPSTPAQTQHTHTWQRVDRVVHHDAQTHKENRKTGTVEYIDCTRYGYPYFTVITEYDQGSFYQVCKLSNGSVFAEFNKESDRKDLAYFRSLFNISYDDESYQFNTRTEDITAEVTVTDREAYDERVDHYVCSSCGQERY